MSPEVPPGLRPGGRFDAWRPAAVRYIGLDVDGTLVGATDEVRADVVDVVTELRQAGVAVGYATGRMHAALGDIDARLRLPGPHVVHNGALIRNDGRTVAAWPLNDDEVEQLLMVSRTQGTYAELYLEQGYLVTAFDERARPHWDLLGLPPEGLADARGDRSVVKFTFIAFDADERDLVVDAIEGLDLAAGAAGSLLTPGLHYVNATRGGVHKGAALATAAEIAGTDLASTMVVGDGSNDLPMLAVAGTAVAMGQASDVVKAAAHLVTDEVDDGGLALALRTLALA